MSERDNHLSLIFLLFFIVFLISSISVSANLPEYSDKLSVQNSNDTVSNTGDGFDEFNDVSEGNEFSDISADDEFSDVSDNSEFSDVSTGDGFDEFSDSECTDDTENPNKGAICDEKVCLKLKSAFNWVLGVVAVTIITGFLVRFKTTRNLRGIFLVASASILGFYRGACPCPISSMQNLILGIIGIDVNWQNLVWFLGLILFFYCFGELWGLHSCPSRRPESVIR